MATRIVPPNENPRQNTLWSDIFPLALGGAGVYFAYNLALRGKLGASAQQAALDICSTFGRDCATCIAAAGGTAGLLAGVKCSGGKVTPGGGAPSGGGAGGGAGGGTMGTVPILPASDLTPAPNDPGWYWDTSGRNDGWMVKPSGPGGVANEANWFFGGTDNSCAQIQYKC